MMAGNCDRFEVCEATQKLNEFVKLFLSEDVVIIRVSMSGVTRSASPMIQLTPI